MPIIILIALLLIIGVVSWRLARPVRAQRRRARRRDQDKAAKITLENLKGPRDGSHLVGPLEQIGQRHIQPDPPELNDAPIEVSDAELLAEYQRIDEMPRHDASAIIREIGRRGLDL